MTTELLLAVIALSLAALALLLALTAQFRYIRLRRAYSLLQGDAEHSSFIVAVARKTAEIERLREELAGVRGEIGDLRATVEESIRRVALLQYDAFGDLSGRQSWSLALLDEAGDGIVLTSITGRAETRTYATAVTAGKSGRAMSPEETEVVAAAMRGSVPAPRTVDA